jgi:hypothetical protein
VAIACWNLQKTARNFITGFKKADSVMDNPAGKR